MKKILVIFLGLAVLGTALLVVRFVLGGNEDDWICDQGQWVKHGNPQAPKPSGGCGEVEETGESEVGLANPAAVYCEELGYRLEAVETEAGQDAKCVFDDGSSCGQWEFFRGECGQEWK